MRNDINKYVDITPVISYESLAELLCLSLALVDGENVCSVPMNVVDIICGLIDSNSDRLNELVSVLDIVAYDNSPVLFRRALSEALDKYLSDKPCCIDYTDEVIRVAYVNDQVTRDLCKFGNGIGVCGVVLARLVNIYYKEFRVKKTEEVRKRTN